ncbi:SAM-dependent methyltransferase [Streptomyces sp. NBC_01363]|uniref:SAM-dependent methyltransferase n=1 Tax=Streptomyces sp. NBC_01363 TaxID=2903840 RepID=UPI00225B271C|nr:SAM-dependent methyltransferase [Streptomyces sp. NBC_01363]MCX4734105.1 SAM-dependent methyltransferase [Streptomyces sp. NBC_01363]
MRPVSHTTQWTAAARALESERTDALFHDAYARPLAGHHGFRLLEEHPAGGLVEFVAIRTRNLDRAIEAACRDGEVRQVVLVACGLDTRAFRLSWPQEAVVYELDHADLLEAKQDRLDELNAEPGVRRVPVAADLAQDWESALLAAGFDPQSPALWVPEALPFSLESTAAEQRLGALSAPGSILAVDILGAWALRNPAAQGFMRAMRDNGTAWQFGTDAPEELLERSGWKPVEILQPGEPGAGEGRWPYQVHSRSRRFVPRNFLVTATK